ELDDELVEAGLAREVVRLIQEARKNSGFEVSDRITLVWNTLGEAGEATSAAIRANRDLIADEVLAEEVLEGDSGDGGFSEAALGLTFWVAKRS
ncbi:MAG: DUF5915 domain-containing protein, partial [Propionibacteriaceae bacterium]|nr:DUF5915 domain-containing protein [Propionibacteriaceae bacterium]